MTISANSKPAAVSLFAALLAWYRDGVAPDVNFCEGQVIVTSVSWTLEEALAHELSRYQLAEKSSLVSSAVSQAAKDFAAHSWIDEDPLHRPRVQFKIVEQLLSLAADFGSPEATCALTNVLSGPAVKGLPAVWQLNLNSLAVTMLGQWVLSHDRADTHVDGHSPNNLYQLSLLLVNRCNSVDDAWVLFCIAVCIFPAPASLLNRLKPWLGSRRALSDETAQAVSAIKTRIGSRKYSVRVALLDSGLSDFNELLGLVRDIPAKRPPTGAKHVDTDHTGKLRALCGTYSTPMRTETEEDACV